MHKKQGLTILSVALTAFLSYSSVGHANENIVSICDRTIEVKAAIIQEVEYIRRLEFKKQDAATVVCDSITSEELESIHTLLLRNKGLIQLQDNDFDGLKSLQHLDLSDNALNQLTDRQTQDLGELKILRISRNFIHSLSGISRLTSLKHIYADANRISDIGSGVLNDLSSLQTLVLSRNALREISVGTFSNNPNLRNLDLANNAITSFDLQAFDANVTLERLNLAANLIEKIDLEALEKLNNIKAVNLSRNPLASSSAMESEKKSFELVGVRLILQDSEKEIKFKPIEERTQMMRSVVSDVVRRNRWFGCFFGCPKLADVGSEELLKPKKLILTFLDLEVIGVDDFSGFDRVEILNMSNNHLKSLPDGFFANLPALKLLALSENEFSDLEKERVFLAAQEHGVRVIFGNGDDSDSTQIDSPIVKGSISTVKSFVENYWHVPLNISVVPSLDSHIGLVQSEKRALEEELATRQVYEIRAAYYRAAVDFFDVQIAFDKKVEKTNVKFDGKSAALKITIKDEIATQDQILSALVSGFSWERDYFWYRSGGKKYGKMIISEEDLRSALQRDYQKFLLFSDELKQDILRLQYLSENAQQRYEELKDDRVYFTSSEVELARYLQYHALFTLQRILNTMVRWSVTSEDVMFPYRGEAAVLLAGGSWMHQIVSDRLLHTIVGNRSVINVFSETWRHRNPIFKILDSEVPEGAIEINGRRSPRIPEGSVRAMLGQRLNIRFQRWCKELTELEDSASDQTYYDSFLSAEMQTVRSLIKSNVVMYKRQLSALRAAKELWDANIKDTLNVPIYGIISEVAGFMGDTRIIKPKPAITDEQLVEMESMLKPGDILLERADYFFSNAFLPGFWPHTIIYLGKKEEWASLRMSNGRALGEDPWIQQNILSRYISAYDEHPARVIEAISEGVVFNSMHHAVQKDDIAIIRPLLSEAEIADSIARALKHHGKSYDFDFNFFTDDKIVCSELAYRAFNPIINFDVQKNAVVKPSPRVPGLKVVAGRDTMPSQEIAELAIYMQSHETPDPVTGYPGKLLEVIATFTKPESGGVARVMTGAEAMEELKATLKR